MALTFNQAYTSMQLARPVLTSLSHTISRPCPCWNSILCNLTQERIRTSTIRARPRSSDEGLLKCSPTKTKVWTKTILALCSSNRTTITRSTQAIKQHSFSQVNMLRNSIVVQWIEAPMHLASPCNMNLLARSTASPWTTRKGKIDQLLTSFSSTVWATGWIRTLRAFKDLASRTGSKQLTWTRHSMDLLLIVGPLSKACLSCKVEAICTCSTIGRWPTQSWYHLSQLTTIYSPRGPQEAPWLTWSTLQLSN